MWFRSALDRWFTKPQGHKSAGAQRHCSRLAVEQLEDRMTPSTYGAASVSDLIADVNAANLNNGASTIVLAPNTTFTLTAADNTTDGANGLPVIANKTNLTVVGNGDTIERSTVAGAPAFRLFDVASGGSLNLENLTLRNGLAAGPTDDSGGAIYNGGTLAIGGCTVAGNNAGDLSFGGQGGGVFNLGTLTIDDSSVSSNTAQGPGGGVMSLGSGSSLTVENSSVCNNASEFGFAYGGGGITVLGGTQLKIDHCVLADNTSYQAGGGAVWLSSVKAEIDNSTLTNNSCDLAVDGGGAIDSSATLTINHCTLSGNGAVDVGGGGAIFNDGTMTINQSTLTDNSASGPSPYCAFAAGGAILNLGTLGINQCTMSDNSVVNNSSSGFAGGAAIFNGGTMTINASTLTDNSTNGYGGAILNDGALTISASTLSGNSAASGGAIHNDDGSILLQSGAGESFGESGPGTLTVEGSTVCGNFASAGADLFNAGAATALGSDVGMIAGSGPLTIKG